MAEPVRGKVAGAAFGLWVAGPMGAALGLALGHAVDRLRRKDEEPPADDPSFRRDFARRLLTLLVEVARADGPVRGREVAAIRTVFLERMGLAGPEADAVRTWLGEALAGKGDAGEATAWLRARVGPRQRIRVLEALHDVARADGTMGAVEERLLVQLADDLGPGEGTFGECYRRLGLLPGATRAEVRRAFRTLAVRHHPDRADWDGPEAERRAAGRFREVREAYERIRDAQGSD